MPLERRTTRTVSVGNLLVGGDAPVSVQTMVKAPPDDAQAILAQIRSAAELGCELNRVAIPNREALGVFEQVRRESPVPLVADIHFNEELALGAIDAGADKVRINPGNMKDWDAIGAVVRRAQEKGVALRIGVNSGSVRSKDEVDALRPMPELLCEAALTYIERIEGMGFGNFVVSVKASDVGEMIAANLALAAKMDYPLHLGVTAAGPEEDALLKSAAGVGGLLAQGIGDTIRLSFTGTPESEVVAGYRLLEALGVRQRGVEVISCPTCGRCKVDLLAMVRAVKERLSHIRAPLRVAVMGCEVNGPGEAKDADIGIAAGSGKYALFCDGKLLRTVSEAKALDALCEEVEKLDQCLEDCL